MDPISDCYQFSDGTTPRQHHSIDLSRCANGQSRTGNWKNGRDFKRVAQRVRRRLVCKQNTAQQKRGFV